MYNATYWRAKEGELARTILATRGVQMARVHIATSGSQPFQAPVDLTASVTVSTGGTGLASAQAEAIRFMVASAVGNLLPSNVSVIDSDLGLLLAAGQDSVGITGQRLDARADALRSNVERLLSARVGPGNAIVEVMVDANRVSERVQARQLDPDGAVRISSDSETLSGSASGNSGNVTVASNLPDGDAGGAGGNSSSEAQSRELVNFDVSETVTERVINPGAIERLSVAVMINEADGSPRAEEEIAVLTGLVKSAVGFDAERGDVVTLESLPFERLDGLGSTASGGLFGGGMFDLMPILQMLILSAVLLAIGLFVIRPIVTGTGGTAPALGVEEGMGELGPDGSPALLGDAMRAGGQDVVDAASLSDPVEELQGQIAERSDDALRLLQHWIEKDDYVENKT